MSENEEEKGTRVRSSQSDAQFVSALDYVDAEIDLAEQISELSIEGLVALMVLQVAHNPDAVRISVTKASRLVVMEFDVDKDDIRYVIGRGGHTIDAIRSIARSVLGESDLEYLISVLEDGKPIVRTGGRRHPNRRRYQRGSR